MTPAEGRRGRRRGAVAPLLCALCLGAVVAASRATEIELDAAERQARFDRITVPDQPLQRLVLGDQRLVVWLPEGLVLTVPGGRTQVFSDEQTDTSLTFSLYELAPGTGLIPLVETVLERLRSEGFLRQVESVRQTRLAGRPAIEVAGRSQTGDGAPQSCRLVFTIDRDGRYLRRLNITSPPDDEERADTLLKGVLRDWTPLDRGLWDTAFEALRATVAAGSGDLQWARRNRILAAVAEPAAIGQAWVEGQLEAIGREHPVLLLDGLLHPHPRVRRASLAALLALGGTAPPSALLLARTLQDPDPAVRRVAAEAAAADRELATEVWRRVLAVDSTVARSGALQLLVVLDPELRRQLLSAAFDGRDQLPTASQPLLAAALGRWGPAGTDAALLRAWKRSTDASLTATALGELLRRGEPTALAAARERLREPLSESVPPLGEAAVAVAARARPDSDAELLGALAAGLATAADEAQPHRRSRLKAAHKVLDEAAAHLRELPPGASAAEECPALARRWNRSADNRWIAERATVLACPRGEPDTPVLRLELREPGSFGLALADLLQRLELGSPAADRLLQTSIARWTALTEGSLADPLSGRSVGVDMAAPWRLTAWLASEEGVVPAQPAVATALRARSTDAARLADTLLGAWTAELTPDDLQPGLLLTAALPLTPALLGVVWEDRRRRSLGEDTAAAPDPVESHVVAFGRPLANGAVRHTLLRLQTYRQRAAEWQSDHLAVDGEEVVLSSTALPLEGRTAWPEAAADGDGAVMDLDLATLLEQLATGPEALPPVGGGEVEPRLVTRSSFDGQELATRFRLQGLDRRWQALARGGPTRELRAPSELLPADTLLWVGARFDPAALATLADDERGEGWLPEAAKAEAGWLRRLIPSLGGEGGAAVVGFPDLNAGPDAAWQERLVVYADVDPAAARDTLAAAMDEAQRHGTVRVYRKGELRAAILGRFLVVGRDAELLAGLGRGERLAATPFYSAVMERSAAHSAVVAALNVDFFADSLLADLGGDDDDDDDSLTRLAVASLRAFGPVVAWLAEEAGGLVGAVQLRPALLSESAAARARRLIGYVDATAGSIRVAGFPEPFGVGSAERLELTATLPEGIATPPAETAGRVRRLPLDAGRQRIVSILGEPLPPSSPVSLPIAGEGLAPYLRSEAQRDFRRGEIRRLAEEIRGDETDPARIVRAIVAWASEHLDYARVRETVGVEQTLATRQADCTEFTDLTIALARSLGIPARPVDGVSIGSAMAYLHRWAEVYLDRWYEVDATLGVTQVPARNVRLPDDQALAMASIPGGSLTLESASGPDGRLVVRLPPGPDCAPPCRAEIAAADDGVTVSYPIAGEAGGERQRILWWDARRAVFQEVAEGNAGGRLIELLGTPAGPVRVNAGADGTPELYRLDPAAGAWRAIPLPPPVGTAATGWSIAATEDGYLFLTDGPPARLYTLTPRFDLRGEIPLPEGGEGSWRLADDQPLAVRSLTGRGISLHRLGDDGSWVTLVTFPDSASLRATRLSTGADRIAVACEAGDGAAPVVLWSSADGLATGRLPPGKASSVADATTVGGFEWAVRTDADALLLTRLPR